MKNLLFAFLVLAAFSCSDDENPNRLEPFQACGVEDVVQNLPWLAEKTIELEKIEIGSEYSYISAAEFNSQTVFIFQNCCPFCDVAFAVYDRDGTLLGYLGQDGFDNETVTGAVVIWKSSKNSCNFPD